MLSLQLGQTAQFPSSQFCKQQTAPLINCSTTILFVSIQVAVDPKLVPRMPYNGRPGRGQKSFTNAGQGLGFAPTFSQPGAKNHFVIQPGWHATSACSIQVQLFSVPEIFKRTEPPFHPQKRPSQSSCYSLSYLFHETPV